MVVTNGATYGILGHFERYLDMTLGTKIVDLGWLNLSNDIDQIGAIAEVAVMVDEFCWPCKER